jgi:hypothetical protein
MPGEMPPEEPAEEPDVPPEHEPEDVPPADEPEDEPLPDEDPLDEEERPASLAEPPKSSKDVTSEHAAQGAIKAPATRARALCGRDTNQTVYHGERALKPSYTHALFRISPTPPAPGTMYWWSSSPARGAWERS